MTEKQLREIMDNDSSMSMKKYEDVDRALEGFKILAKYSPKHVVQGAGHDIVWSLDIIDAIKFGITEEDAKTLCEMNWFIDDECDCFAKYV